MSLEDRLAELEAKVAQMNEHVEQARTAAAIKRGIQEVEAGRFKPAREVLEQLRKKHRIPRR